MTNRQIKDIVPKAGQLEVTLHLGRTDQVHVQGIGLFLDKIEKDTWITSADGFAG